MGGELPTQSGAPVLTPGRVYLHHSRRKELLRLICIDAGRGQLIFKIVKSKWDRVEKFAKEMELDRALTLVRAGKLVEEPDYIRPSYLSLEDDKLKQLSGKTPEAAAAWLKARDDNYVLIRDLVEHDDPFKDRSNLLALAYSPLTCSAIVNAHAERVGVSPLVIKRLLHKYAWFGLDKNALLNRDPFKGRTDAFATKYKAKPGPPNAAVKLFGEKYRGRARARKDLTIILMALDLYYVSLHMTLTETYEAMLKHFYFQANQYGLFPIRRGKAPTFRQFTNAAQKISAKLNLEVKRDGHKDGKEKQGRRGHDTDIADAVADVFDIDGTPFNKELVSTYKVDGKTFNTGKATALVIFDRRSKKGVGWHVYVGAENWKEGYRLALFCALTSKNEHLKWLEIDDPTAWPDDENIVPSFVYVDGGPGASKKGQDALSRLLIDFFRAPPDTPYWKPMVEGGQRILQDAQAHDGGGYKRTNDAVDKDFKRKAKLYANDTVWELERKLVLDLIRYNRKRHSEAKLTFEMKAEGVRPTPEAIFSWGVKKMGGVQKRRLLESDVYEALLDHQQAEVTINGVFLLSSRYQSMRLAAYRNYVGKNVKIGVMSHPLRPREVYWRTPDGVIDRLERDEEGNRNFGLGSAHDITEYHKRMLAAAIVESHNTRPKNVLSNRQCDQILRAAGVKPKQQRKTATGNASILRAIEAIQQQATRPYDRPERNAPHLTEAPLPLEDTTMPNPATSNPTGAVSKPAAIRRGRTADLFELRRQQASKKKPG